MKDNLNEVNSDVFPTGYCPYCLKVEEECECFQEDLTIS